MSFLAPLFLVGAAAIAAPIIFHLIRRTSKEKTIFSSLMFLQPTPPRLTRRSRLENIFLLILRCLVLCLLALGFARPFLQRPLAADPAGQAKKMVLLLDTSASMRRENLWPQARAKAEEYLRSAGPADSLAIFTFDQRIHPMLSFEQWSTLALGQRVSSGIQQLGRASPGWAGTHLGNALISAVEAIEDSRSRDSQSGARRQVIVISDMQEGAHLEGLQGYEWPKGLEFVFETVKPKKTSNAGLQLVLEREEADFTTPDGPPRIRVSNSHDSSREQFQVGWLPSGDAAFVGAALPVYVAPGENRIVQAPAVPAGLREQRLALIGDDQDFDNTLFIVPPRAEQIPVLFLGDDPRDYKQSLLYYVKRAFPQTKMQSVQIVARTNNAMITAADVSTVQLAMVDESIGEDLLKISRQLLEQGKTIVFPMRSVQGVQLLSKLLGSGAIGVEEAPPSTYAMLEQIDFESPIFAPFDDPRFNDFTKIHFWKHRRLETNNLPNAKVLARFDKGDPAVLQVSAGKGTLVVLTSGWQPDDSQLALSSKFVPMLYALLQQSGSIKAHRSQYLVGDSVAIGPVDEGGSLAIQTPQGTPVPLHGTDHFTETLIPGIYASTRAQNPLRFAVNIPPEESKTAPLAMEELQRLGLPLKAPVVDPVRQLEQKKHLQNVELEARQKLWKWLIVAALVVLMVETWVAGWVTRRATVQTGATV